MDLLNLGMTNANNTSREDLEDDESRMATLFRPLLPGANNRSLFTHVEIEHIGQLLQGLGKHEWSRRPRTYAILRMINRLDSMKFFTVEGLYDISLPYSDITLPQGLDGVVARSKFLELQCLVLDSDGANLENGKGMHAHFDHAGVPTLECIKVLGSGGFGKVDHVRSRLSLNEFARKQIPRGRTFKKDKAAVADFERELNVLKRLSHRHLVKFLGSYTDPRSVGIIMTPVADCNLAEYIQSQQLPLASETAKCLRSFYGCLTAAVLYLHESQIRHKDIKPTNILVHGDTPLLTDFGTSLDWSEKERSTTRDRPDVLSPAYCSPEVAAWEPRNSSSDIWSLGCVFFEMASILKGQSLEQMREFFSQSGSGGRHIRTNPEATQAWYQKLMVITNPECENNGPLFWAFQMVRPNAKARPTASELYARITSFRGVHSYCGPCCACDDVKSESSDDETSITAEFAASIDPYKFSSQTRPLVPDDRNLEVSSMHSRSTWLND